MNKSILSLTLVVTGIVLTALPSLADVVNTTNSTTVTTSIQVNDLQIVPIQSQSKINSSILLRVPGDNQGGGDNTVTPKKGPGPRPPRLPDPNAILKQGILLNPAISPNQLQQSLDINVAPGN
ncbi:hypothetical protein [Brunnivagina elsteri]|uniref:Uncharacterized protein n=1 Tax=Brunnivagina elsteri CCALA 953 TaxID=987040 RepID=A0A2A2TFQ2_9CYAN|nr:hypothetical protein [Calothrix elsteri]PAX52574.1 hypothetical protein CK510_18570 [Calothrix elsteri CCALA 953]